MLTFLVTHTCGVNTLQKQLEPIPAPDTTALVTLRDKPLGGNDIMPRVQVRCWRQKYQNILYINILYINILYINLRTLFVKPVPIPDKTAWVTLRDKPLGGNDIMPIVQVRCWRHKYQNILYIYKPKDPICETGSNTGQDGIGHS